MSWFGTQNSSALASVASRNRSGSRRKLFKRLLGLVCSADSSFRTAGSVADWRNVAPRRTAVGRNRQVPDICYDRCERLGQHTYRCRDYVLNMKQWVPCVAAVGAGVDVVIEREKAGSIGRDSEVV